MTALANDAKAAGAKVGLDAGVFSQAGYSGASMDAIAETAKSRFSFQHTTNLQQRLAEATKVRDEHRTRTERLEADPAQLLRWVVVHEVTHGVQFSSVAWLRAHRVEADSLAKAALADLLDAVPQALILSLHSFTPQLASHPDELRPWQVGVLYNQDDRAARIAIPLLQAEGLVVGDQEPYSGKLLNATMNRHAEAEGRPYLGIEIRQDEIASPQGQALWAERLARVCHAVALGIGG